MSLTLGITLSLATGVLVPSTAPFPPSLEWETIISATSETLEGGSDAVVDAGGNVIVMGYLAVEQDFYLLKFDPKGDLLWDRTIGGSGLDLPGDLVVDNAGDIYVVGRTFSADFPTLLAYQDFLNGPADAFLMKLSGSDGSTQFATYFGGTHGESGDGIALGADGTITIVGSTDSIDLETVAPVQSGLTLIECFCEDAYVTQFSRLADEVLFSTYLGGTFDDLANDVRVDSAGNIYVAGHTSSEDFLTDNAQQPAYGGGDYDAFVAKIANDHSIGFSTYLGGEDWELVQGMDIDDGGAVYVTGSTRSISFPTTPGAFEEDFVGGILACSVPFGGDHNCYDMFVTKIMDNGALGYSTFVGGGQDDEPRNIAVDAAGRAHVIGYTYSDDFPMSVPFGNVVALQLSADGSAINYVVTHSTPGANAGSGVAVQGNDLFIASSVGLPYDTYVAKFVTAINGDGDTDGDVDLDDYAVLADCLLGPGGGIGTGCAAFDIDADGDVTLFDVAAFASNFTGD